MWRPGLQCGRGPKPTEIQKVLSSITLLRIASMWPRAEAHGNFIHPHARPRRNEASMWPRAEAHGNQGVVAVYEAVAWLQCGRGPKPTEICVTQRRSCGTRSLQCGRGPKPTEIVPCREGTPPLSPLQCGRGPKPTEIYRVRAPRMRTGSFNVAAGRSPRKYHTAWYNISNTYASMWPRAEAHGNFEITSQV